MTRHLLSVVLSLGLFDQTESLVIGHFPFVIFHFSENFTPKRTRKPRNQMTNDKWKMTNDQ